MIHEIAVRVRFNETDLLGHVNNTSFFIYMEDARTQFFQTIKDARDSTNFILASAKCDFIDQAYFNQNLKVKTVVSKIGNKSFQFNHEIVEEGTEKLIAVGEATVVCFNFKTQKSEPISAELRSILEEWCLIESKQK